VLHFGFDGWQAPVRDVPMERGDAGAWTAQLPDVEGHHVVDCVVTDGEDCDNNDGADYRLWVGLDPVDSHVHARTRGAEPMGLASLNTALLSGGMTHALVSWQDNRFVDEVAGEAPWLTRLVWVRPGVTRVPDVRQRLADSAVGLKLHPVFDAFLADTPALDPYLQVAADAAAPVTVHSSPGPADPDMIRRLAERFPTVPFVLYHTYLGMPEGRRRAARHASEIENMYLETSWCRSEEVERLLDEAGPDKVLFGSDAAVDGPHHFVRQPPNVEMVESYNGGLLRLARRLEPEVLHRLLEGNTRHLFRLGAPRRTATTRQRPTPRDHAREVRPTPPP
jgi:hypothetical protein